MPRCVRWKGKDIAEAGFRIIKREGVESGYLHASDSRGFHLFEFPPDFRLRNCRTEPPPTHHEAAVVGRVREGLA